jgi:hypothetical protein
MIQMKVVLDFTENLHKETKVYNNMIMLRWNYTSSEKIKEKFDNPDVIIVNIDDLKHKKVSLHLV